MYLSDIFEMYKNNEKVELNNDKYAPDNIDDNSFIKFDLQTDKAIFHNVDVYCNKWFHGRLRNYPNSNLEIRSEELITIFGLTGITIESNNDSINIGSNLIPTGTDVRRNLGSNESKWENLYVNNILGRENITIHSNLIPMIDNGESVLTLGSQNSRWEKLYTTEIDTISMKVAGVIEANTVNVIGDIYVANEKNDLEMYLNQEDPEDPTERQVFNVLSINKFGLFPQHNGFNIGTRSMPISYVGTRHWEKIENE